MKKEDKQDLIKVKNILGIIFAIGKSLFLAVTQVAWGIASIFFLNLMIVYFIKDGIPFEVSKLFLQIENFILNQIMSFVGIFFVLYSYYEIRDVLK